MHGLEGSQDKDVNRALWEISVKDTGELGGRLQFFLFGEIIEQDGDFVIIVGYWDGDAPESELRASTSKVVGVLGLNECFEILDSVA